MQSKDAHGIKPLLDIWFHALNQSDIFTNQKSDFCETIRMTPYEQTDLYEILSQDKTNVLEAYLKGEKHDPSDINVNLIIHIRSFYVLITEQKKQAEEIFHIRNRPKNCEVRKWWDQSHAPIHPTSPVSSPTGATEKSRLLPQTPEHKTPHAPTKLIKLEETPKTFSDHIPGGRRFTLITNTNETQKSESFMKHLMDVEKDGGSNFLLDENDDEIHITGGKIDTAQSEIIGKYSRYWWNQNLLLIIEILQINASINKYQNNKIMTDKDSPLKIGSIMVTTALNLPEATRHRKVDKDHTILTYEHILSSILSYDFSQVPSGSSEDVNPIIRFLKEEGFYNFANFLEMFSRYIYEIDVVF